ncbi:hypothetical protein Tco_0090855 [Tanacetum coccineum]
MNYLLQAMPNDIYNSMDACKDSKTTWERIKRLMHGSDITEQERHSRLMNEFDKFVAMEGESLASVYERMTTLVNVMDQNKFRPPPISVNTKFLNSLQPEWSKYVTMTRQSLSCSFKCLFFTFSCKFFIFSFTTTILCTHPSSVIVYEEDYQGDAQEDKLTTAIMLLARAITQRYSTPTNNRLRTSSNTMNQAVIHDGWVDIQSKNVGYAGNGNTNAGRQNRFQEANAGNSLV